MKIDHAAELSYKHKYKIVDLTSCKDVDGEIAWANDETGEYLISGENKTAQSVGPDRIKIVLRRR